MRKWVVMLTAVALTTILHSGVDSANINDLGDAYDGPASSTNNSSLEEAGFSFEVKSRDSNGRFTGNLLGSGGFPSRGR